jgi:hypothetical protein
MKINVLLLSIIAIEVAVLFTGCPPPIKKPIPDPDTRTQGLQAEFADAPVSDIADLLPARATNIRSLGNDWWQFELRIANCHHTFVCNVSPANCAIRAVTEILTEDSFPRPPTDP